MARTKAGNRTHRLSVGWRMEGIIQLHWGRRNQTRGCASKRTLPGVHNAGYQRKGHPARAGTELPVKTAQHCWCRPADSHRHAFTLVEVLVVIAIIGVLAALLLSALSSAKASSQESVCLGNLRQLQIAFQIYATDNGGYLAQNISLVQEPLSSFGTNSWVYGNMKNVNNATNTLLIKNGELFPYTPQSATYHCPADTTVDDGQPRLRSYSMNSWIGSAEMEAEEQESQFRIFLKESDLAAGKPSAIWVMLDENAATLGD